MDAFDMPQIEEAHRQNGELYHEFIRANRLSVGLYVLEAGATDPQKPHTEDEIAPAAHFWPLHEQSRISR